MAWTITRTNTVFGNKQVRLLKCTADATTQTIDTGLAVVEHFSVGYGSMSTLVGPKIFPNSGAGGTPLVAVGCTSFVVGDDIYITVFGR